MSVDLMRLTCRADESGMEAGESEVGEYGQEGSGSDRRRHKRLNYTGRANVSRGAELFYFQGMTIDLSYGGCLLRMLTRAEFEVDDEVDFSIQSADLSFRARAIVRRVSDGATLVGLSFEGLTTRGRRDLDQLIAELEGTE